MYEEFRNWSTSDQLAFWAIVVAILSAALPFTINWFKRRDKHLEVDLASIKVLVFEPKDNALIPIYHHENQIERYVSGRVQDLTKRQIRSLDLKIQVSVKTDDWYIQDADDGKVLDDGTWNVRFYFGRDGIGKNHIIEILLKDKYGRKGQPIKLIVHPER